MSEQNTKRAKNIMYQQQLSHLPFADINELAEAIKTRLQPKRYAIILHDKDYNPCGTPKAPHIHAMLSFDNARQLTAIAKALNDNEQSVTAWRGNSNNGYAYLCHRTREAKAKYQYNPDEVICNFDYHKFLNEVAKELAENKQTSSIKSLLDMLYNGDISKADVEDQLSGSQYARYHRQIDDVYAKRLKNLAEQFMADMKAENRSVQVVWLYGESGTGKTSLAIEFAEKKGQPYFVTGSTRDIFQNYNGEHTLIIDELRPDVINYPDLLRILDPFGVAANLPSRYHDKALACDLIIITTPFSPFDFYSRSFSLDRISPRERNDIYATDSFDQLYRRLSLIILVDDYYIHPVEFNSVTCCFDYVSDANGNIVSRKNKYSKLNRPPPIYNSMNLFNSLFE